jgi:hypothetical protein
MNDFRVDRVPQVKGKKGTRGQLVEEKYDALWSKKDQQPARVSMGVSQSAEFGSIKVSANVSLACDQTETAINKAGELAYTKAYELMTDGWNELCADLQAAADQETARQGG